MRVQSNKEKRGEAFSWLLSYLSVLLVPIVISGLVYLQSINILYSNIVQTNQSLLLEIQKILDTPLRDMERISTEISYNFNISTMLNNEKEITSRQAAAYETAALAKELKLYKLGNDYIEDIYIYHRGTGTFIGTSAKLDVKLFYDAYVKPNEGSMEAWENFLTDSQSRAFMPLYGKRADDSMSKLVLFRNPLSYSYYTQAETDVIFVVSQSKLFRRTQTKKDILNYDINVLDGNNNVVLSTDSGKDYSFIDYENLLKNGGKISKKNQYVILQASSGVYNWKYLMIVNAKNFWEKSQYIKWLMVLSIILCLLVGGVVSYMFTKRNHNSIRDLVNSVAKKAGINIDKKNDAFQFLQELASKTIAENEKIAYWKEQQGKNLRDSFLVRLLKGNVEADLPVDEYLNAYDMEMGSGCFGVLLFFIEDYSKFSAKDHKMDSIHEYKLVQFIITNIVEEMSNQKNHGYMCEIDRMMCCIVNFKGDHELENKEDLVRIAREAQQVIKDHFEIRLSISVSNIFTTIQGISAGYQQAMDIMEYKMVIGTGKILQFSDISKNNLTPSHQYYYPLQLENQLINCVKTADIASASAIVSEIFEKNFSERSISMQMTECLLFNMINTMIKAVNEISDLYGSDFADEFDPVRRLTNCETIEKMKIEMMKMLEESCEYVGKKKNDGGQPLCEEIKKYVKLNYRDEDLSISKIGEYANMSPSYISKLFKEQSGTGLLDYIGMIRIEEAKHLMKEYDYTIQEVGKAVGYSDRKTFARAFKKFEGITPGKFIN